VTSVAIISTSGLASTTTGTGSTTITATSGAISGSASLTVTTATLVSIAVTPSSASIIQGGTQQFTATGTYSNNSTQNLTSTVAWSSSVTSVAIISTSGLASTTTGTGSTTITATSGAISGSATLQVTAVVTSSTLTVTLIGTGNGTVTDNLEQINCTTTAGVQSGACSGSYTAGTVVTLTATPSSPSTFAGWGGACSGTAGCSVTLTTSQSVTASFAPPPQMIPVSFAPGTSVTGMATYDCPSNPNPSPSNPCPDPNAHATTLNIGQIITPFTLTVVATEISPINADGICSNGLTPTQDFDCRFKSFFTYQTKANGDTVVPLCYPYANGNCVLYTVYYQTPGTEPDPSWYVGPVNWTITWNNDKFVPPAPYTGSTPHLYDDPDGFVLPNSPYGTNCNSPMLVGNPGTPTTPPIFCQFVFDITTFFDPTKKVDSGIGGKTRVFNDVIVAFPPANTGNLSVTTAPATATVTAGSPLSLTITVTDSAGGAVVGATLTDALPAGTNISWSISPSYLGPGSCAITGAVGSQVLNCSFGTINASQTFTISLLSASSLIGNYTNSAVVSIGNQQILSIASMLVQPVTVAFTGLTPSQSIFAGASNITLSGTIGNGTSFPTAGEMVSITINGATQSAAIGANGAFTASFPTATIPASASPYTITYSYAGDAIFSTATDTSTTLTVNPVTLVSIAVTPASSSIAKGITQQFTAIGTYSNSTTQNLTSTATWTSSVTSVATISTTGLATGTGVGSSTITAKSGSISGTATLTVTAPTLVSLAVTPNPASIAVGGTQQFTATGTYTDSSTQNLTTSATWSSSPTAVATISTGGLATGVGAGSATITAASGPVSGTATLTVTASSGEPLIHAAVLGTGTVSGQFYVDVQFKNAGAGIGTSVTITGVTFRTLTGTGTVTYNSTLSPPIPDSLGTLNVGATVTVRYFINAPTTVTHFSINESGTVTDASSKTFTFAAGQAVAY